VSVLIDFEHQAVGIVADFIWRVASTSPRGRRNSCLPCHLCSTYVANRRASVESNAMLPAPKCCKSGREPSDTLQLCDGTVGTVQGGHFRLMREDDSKSHHLVDEALEIRMCS